MKSDKTGNNKDALTRFKQWYGKLVRWQRWLVWVVLLFVGVLVLIAAGRAYTVETQQNLQSQESAAEADSSLFNKAESQYQDGNFKQAAKIFRQYADSATGHQRFHGLMRSAEAYEKGEDFVSALSVYELVIEDGEEEVPHVQYVSVLGSAAQAAEQTKQLELAQEYNQRQIVQLEKIAGSGEDTHEDIGQLLKNAKEYRKHLQSRIDFQQYQAERAEVEAEEEKARVEAEAETEAEIRQRAEGSQ